MATTIKAATKKKSKTALHKEIKDRFDTPGRNPEKALNEMYGIWEGRDISIEQIREKKRRKKW